MPKIKSAKKRLRQSGKRTLRNKAVTSRLKTVEKTARQAVLQGPPEQAAARVRLAEKLLAQAAAKRIIPKRRASRHASKLAKRLAKSAAAPSAL